jgi:hypothetical protein
MYLSILFKKISFFDENKRILFQMLHNILLLWWDFIDIPQEFAFTSSKKPSPPNTETMARGSTLFYQHPKAGLFALITEAVP